MRSNRKTLRREFTEALRRGHTDIVVGLHCTSSESAEDFLDWLHYGIFETLENLGADPVECLKYIDLHETQEGILHTLPPKPKS